MRGYIGKLRDLTKRKCKALRSLLYQCGFTRNIPVYRAVSRSQKVGMIGEKYAKKHLQREGFSILHRNYANSRGEIDIIASKDKKLHFVEVKSVSHETGEPGEHDEYSAFAPELRVNRRKRRALLSTISLYLMSNRVSPETYWQADIVSVHMYKNNTLYRAEVLSDIVLI